LSTCHCLSRLAIFSFSINSHAFIHVFSTIALSVGVSHISFSILAIGKSLVAYSDTHFVAVFVHFATLLAQICNHFPATLKGIFHGSTISTTLSTAFAHLATLFNVLAVLVAHDILETVASHLVTHAVAVAHHDTIVAKSENTHTGSSYDAC
jgi:hypothetical protein